MSCPKKQLIFFLPPQYLARKINVLIKISHYVTELANKRKLN